MTFRLRLALILGVLAVINLVAWAMALHIVGSYPILIGSTLLAYGLGLRHAFDADHIAAIDNVTRRLVADGKRSVGVGFYFSLGHSTVVGAATLGIAVSAAQFRNQLLALPVTFGPIGSLLSSLFLLAVTALNFLVLANVWRIIKLQRCDPRTGALTAPSGDLLSRALQTVVRRVDRSWLMYPLGALFGLGFDTATEIGILGLTAAQAAKGLPLWAILIFPALFTSAMALGDTLESLLMLGAYAWATGRPGRRLTYNLAITATSILIGVMIATAQLADMAPKAKAWLRPLDLVTTALTRHSEWIGAAIVLLFVALWGCAVIFDRTRQSGEPSMLS